MVSSGVPMMSECRPRNESCVLAGQNDHIIRFAQQQHRAVRLYRSREVDLLAFAIRRFASPKAGVEIALVSMASLPIVFFLICRDQRLSANVPSCGHCASFL